MKRLLYFQLMVLPLMLMSFIIAGDANAQCNAVPNAFGGVDVVCTGVDNDGFDATDNIDMATIEEGAQVTNPGGPAINLRNANDTFIMNGGTATGNVNTIDGDQGNDKFTINGGVINANSVAINGSSGDDEVIINDGMINEEINLSADADRLMMFGGSITSPDDAVNCGSGNDMIDIKGGEVTGGTDGGGNGIGGGNGEDKISVSFATVTRGNSDPTFASIDGSNGDDQITLGTQAVLNGLVDCGPDFDTLIFAMEVPENQLASLSTFLLSLNPAGDSVTIDNLFYEWEDCEVIVNNLVGVPRVAPIPTLSEWGLIAMAGALGVFGMIYMLRRKQVA